MLVRDAETRLPVPGAVVDVAVGVGVTRESGRIRFAGLPEGEAEIEVAYVGYVSVDTTITVGAAGVQLNVLLVPSTTQLGEVTVEESLNEAMLRRRGFQERQRTRSGVFITRAQLDARGATLFADVFSAVPGVRVVRGRGSAALVSTRNRGCPMTVFVDGIEAAYLGEQIDTFPLATIAAVEVYRGPAETPTEYAYTRGQRTCGAVLVWTRIDNN